MPSFCSDHAEFRAFVETKLPGASATLSKVTGAEYPASAAKSDSAWPAGSTLPDHFETVPEILAKIEKGGAKDAEKETAKDPAEKTAGDSAAMAKKDAVEGEAKETAESETTAAKSMASSDSAKASSLAALKKNPAPAPAASPAVTVAVATPVSAKATPAPAPSPGSPPDVQDAKTKLVRMLGKPSEEGESPFAQKAEVVNSSVFKKPNFSGSKSGNPDGPPPTAEQALSEVLALRRDLESQAQWDAVRIQKAVYAQQLADQKNAATASAEMARTHAAALQRVKDDALERTEKVLEVRTREIELRTAERRDAELKEMLATSEARLRTELEVESFERERAASVARESKLAQAEARVGALSEKFDTLLKHNQLSREAAHTSAAAFALSNALLTDRPFASELAAVAEKTELAAVVAASIAPASAANGVPTTRDLQTAFPAVSRRALGAALVPDNASGTMWGHILGAVFSRLKVRVFDMPAAAVADFDAPASDEDCIRQAQAYVAAGRVDKAAIVLGDVEAPLANTVLSDWLQDAKARTAADQAARVLAADATIAQVALSTTPPKHPAA